MLALIALGVAYRIAVYRSHQILALDEAMLALNVARRGFGALLQPLAFQQTAPVLFLWLTRLAVLVGGVNDAALRAVPFVAGLASIPLVWIASRDLVGPRFALVAAALMTLCPLGIEYGAIVKPYSLDVAVTAALLAVTLAVVRRAPHAYTWWLAAALVTPFLSAPSVFVYLSCLIAVWIAAPTARRIVVAASTLWIAAAGVSYVRFQRAAVTSDYLHHFWASAFPHPPLAAMVRLVQLRTGYMMQDVLTGYSVGYPAVWHWALVLLALGGVVHLWRQRGPWAAILVAGPVLTVGLAAAAQVYPLADRTLLFTAPLIIIAVVAGVDAIGSLVPAARRTAIVATAAAIVVAPNAIEPLAHGFPGSAERVQADLATVWGHVQAGEPVYVFALDVPRWAFYTTDWAHPDTDRVNRLVAMTTRLGPNSGNRPPRDRPVSNEGWDLILRTDGRTELIGIGTGSEILSDGVSHGQPDPGWATNEASRIRGAAAPSAWLVFLHGRFLAPALIDTLVAGGGRLTDSVIVRRDGLVAYRYAR
jgi:hypothetical protein